MSHELTSPLEPDETQFTLETKTNENITGEDVLRLDELAEDEVRAFEAVDRRNNPEESDELGAAGFIHSFALELVKSTRNFSIILAKNPHGIVIGYSLITITHRDQELIGDHAYIGVRRQYQRRGIGIQMLRRHHETLLEMGIRRYEANARDEVLFMYDKVGVRYEHRVSPHGKTGNPVTVHLQ